MANNQLGINWRPTIIFQKITNDGILLCLILNTTTNNYFWWWNPKPSPNGVCILSTTICWLPLNGQPNDVDVMASSIDGNWVCHLVWCHLVSQKMACHLVSCHLKWWMPFGNQSQKIANIQQSFDDCLMDAFGLANHNRWWNPKPSPTIGLPNNDDGMPFGIRQWLVLGFETQPIVADQATNNCLVCDSHSQTQSLSKL